MGYTSHLFLFPPGFFTNAPNCRAGGICLAPASMLRMLYARGTEQRGIPLTTPSGIALGRYETAIPSSPSPRLRRLMLSSHASNR